MKLQEIKNLLNEVIDEVLKEEEDEENTETSEKQEDNIQETDESTIKIVKTTIKNKIEKALQKVENKPKEEIDQLIKKEMGLFENPEILTTLQNIPINSGGMSLKIRPLDIKMLSSTSPEKSKDIDNLKKTNTTTNIQFYKKLQIIPFELVLEDGKKLGAGKGDETFPMIFIIPAFYAIINQRNIPIHQQLFEFKADPKKGPFYHSGIKEVRVIKMAEKEAASILGNLKTGKTEKLKAVNTKQMARRSTNKET